MLHAIARMASISVVASIDRAHSWLSRLVAKRSLATVTPFLLTVISAAIRLLPKCLDKLIRDLSGRAGKPVTRV